MKEVVERLLQKELSEEMWQKLQHDWRAFSEAPEMYEGTVVVAMVAQWLEEESKMAGSEFMKRCTGCGGNWAAMLITGIRDIFPELYASLPDDKTFTFFEICDILEPYVDFSR